MYDILNDGTYTDDVTKFDFNANITAYLLALDERYTEKERDRTIDNAMESAEAMLKTASGFDRPDKRVLNVDIALTCFFALHILAGVAVKQMGEEQFSASQRVAAILRRAHKRYSPD